MRLALLGAESTGKTQLAGEIAQLWRSQGHAVHAVPEVLRAWCDTHGRTPLVAEQAGIAAEQARQALAAPPGNWVVSDTTPMMTAIYSDLLFGDTSLYPMALEHQRCYDLTLVTGLDLPWVADGLQRDGPHVREPVDSRLRQVLDQGGVHYRVVYGSGSQRLMNARFAIESIAPHAELARAGGRFGSQYRPWGCDKCADPECEHRLFTGRWD